MARKPVFKVPKQIGKCADLLFEKQQQRRELQREVDKLAEEESKIKEYIINTLPKSEASGVSGKLARVSVGTKDVPTVEDWDSFYKYVWRTKRFDYLQRRLNSAAIKEVMESGKKVAGVKIFHAVAVSLNKL